MRVRPVPNTKLRNTPGKAHGSYLPEDILKLGQRVPCLELTMLQVAEGVLKSPLAEARGHITQTHKVAALVGRDLPLPGLGSNQLS